MKRRAFPVFGLFARSIGVFLMLCTAVAFMLPNGAMAATGDTQYCVAGGRGYVGPISGDETDGNLVQLNWHGSFVYSVCNGGVSSPQDGDWDIQHITYQDGKTEFYKIVYSTQDLGTLQGAYCYWNLDLGDYGYHCPNGYAAGPLYEWIISSSGDSPYLEPAGSGGWNSNANGRGVYS